MNWRDRLEDTGDVSKAEIKRLFNQGVKARNVKTWPVPPQLNKSKVAESDIMAYIKFTLARYGGWFSRIEAGGVFRRIGEGEAVMTPSRMNGIPDYLWYHQDYGFWGIEAKASSGKLSQDQYDHLESIEKAGGHAVVICTPGGLDLAIDLMEITGSLPRNYPNFPFPVF